MKKTMSDIVLDKLQNRYQNLKRPYTDDLGFFFHGSDVFMVLRGYLDNGDESFETRFFVTRIKYNMDEVEILGNVDTVNETRKLIADYVYETHIKPANLFVEYMNSHEALKIML